MTCKSRAARDVGRPEPANLVSSGDLAPSDARQNMRLTRVGSIDRYEVGGLPAAGGGVPIVNGALTASGKPVAVARSE